MNNKLFGFLCALLGALAVISFVQRVEISTLKLVIYQMTDGDEDQSLEELFEE